MKGRLRYKRVILVGVVCILVLCIGIYMYMNRKRIYEYNGDMTVYNTQYQKDNQIYSFDLKSFILDDIQYISLNDIYNVMLILDNQTRVSIDENQSIMIYQMNDKKYVFDYGHDNIVYNNKCIELENNNEHIYVSHKNIYISVLQAEKILFNNEKKLYFDNKNAIIQQK